MFWRPLSCPPPASVPDAPRFVRIADALSSEIERGRLRPGDRLPGSRELARAFEVNRNTIVSALGELESQGWVRTEERRGTFVSGPALPCRQAPRRPPRRDPDRVGYVLDAGVEPLAAGAAVTAELVLAGGRPDPRMIPTEALARAFRRALRRHGQRLLDYGDAAGSPELRRALGAMLAEARGLAVTADDLVVTRGSQQALYLVARTLIRPGERVVVEQYGYPPAWAAFRQAGASLCPVRVDEHGIVVDDIARILEDGPVRAVYVTPHHQFPTMVVMHPARRASLLELARRHAFAIVEDDYDNEYHYEGRPVLPLASEDHTGNVVYVGTLSKVLAPGLRVGYVAAPRPLLGRIVDLRTVVDRQGDLGMEAALAELLEDGELRRHARRTRREYAARRDALVDGLRRELADVLSFDVPPGGMALWVGTGDLDADAWAAASRERGVGFFPGRVYSFDGRSLPFVRLGYARLTVAELGDAVRRVAAAAREITGLPRPPRRDGAARPATRSARGREPGDRGTGPSRH